MVKRNTTGRRKEVIATTHSSRTAAAAAAVRRRMNDNNDNITTTTTTGNEQIYVHAQARIIHIGSHHKRVTAVDVRTAGGGGACGCIRRRYIPRSFVCMHVCVCESACMNYGLSRVGGV